MYFVNNHSSRKNSRANRHRYFIFLAYLIIILTVLYCQVALGQDSSSTVESGSSQTTVTVNVNPWPVQLMNLMSYVLAFLKAVILNPFGAINAGIVYVIDLITAVLPSTPENLKLSNLVGGISEAVPAVGTAVIQAILNTFIELGGLAIVIKIYKLIPFKAT